LFCIVSVTKLHQNCGRAQKNLPNTEVAQNFPEECRYVLERLGEVYGNDAEAREGGLTRQERLRLHQERSGPVMEKLHGWLEAQFAERKAEPNSGWGKAIMYLLRHWKALTTFLREAGAPISMFLSSQ
jgi:hypothetical protein